ncbi:hypothetical protein AVEN_149705-1 [Araneus ventricosus]|uniref:Uncharacterized protein n=1 Tax=Araneus ventricosus TaxID=182803 RepID=A0A4Y2G775_ARAVE|nr:hypothetical protein AVEN_149705-1 [Araneus ventricosus]
MVGKKDLNNNISRTKIRQLIHFITENETILSPKDGDNDQPQIHSTRSYHLFSAPTDKSPPPMTTTQSENHPSFLNLPQHLTKSSVENIISVINDAFLKAFTHLLTHEQSSVAGHNPRATTVAQRPIYRGAIAGLKAKYDLPNDYGGHDHNNATKQIDSECAVRLV